VPCIEETNGAYDTFVGKTYETISKTKLQVGRYWIEQYRNGSHGINLD
jgi:hypothetical protein